MVRNYSRCACTNNLGNMTLQSMEQLIYRGRKVRMATEPLSGYLKSHKEKPEFFPASSGCWRGYVGTWEIKDEKLYLIAIDGYARFKPKTYSNVDMNYLFPNQKRIFAEWFTGELRIPDGDVLRSSGIYDLTYELDLFLEIKNGHFVGKRLVDNLLNKAAEDYIREILSKKKSVFNRILDRFKMKK
jgi:hypothetical protein